MVAAMTMRIRTDTGGTFTDCWAVGEGEDRPRLVKVLSSGVLRVAVVQWVSDRELEIATPVDWRVAPHFFTGYRLRSGEATALVISHERADDPEAAEAAPGEEAEATGRAPRLSRLVLSGPVPKGDSVDLFTREEAPVLGARLLTGTPLDAPFPPLEMRIATTRGTNALLERKGAAVALFTTEGFADLGTVRDQRRADLFALRHERPEPLFVKAVEVAGRLDAAGGIVVPLRLDACFDAEVGTLLDAGVETAAVALLHSHRNPVHELAVRERLLALGFREVSLSSELAPHAKLLPRLETAVANAYLQPVMQRFVGHLEERLSPREGGGAGTGVGGEGAGNGGGLLVMTSAGGLEPAAGYRPKDSLLSGPAGGVSGAVAVAGALGVRRLLTFDMGGTSTDVARYHEGFQYRFEQVVGGARVLAPALKIETVAAGGGSICQWRDGGLRVGPESAGADPGPACYGLGGPLTLTDVNLLLGRIDPENFGIPLTASNLDAARAAATALQREAGLLATEPDEAFLAGLLEIAVEQMADAIRGISVRDGADPADYALLAFGGAGPLHACDIAERLGVGRILVPAEAGLLSAFGLECAGVERFAEIHLELPVEDPGLPQAFAETEARALASLREAGYEGGVTHRLFELRLAGQDAALSVETEALPGAPELAEAFRRRYRDTFGYEPPEDRAVEVLSFRAVAGTGRSRGPAAEERPQGETADPIESAPESAGPFLDRARLVPGVAIEGPRVVQDPFCTLYLKAGWRAEVAANGTLDLRALASEPEAADADATDPQARGARPEEIERELYRHRFDSLVAEMGAMLRRSAVSTNVKEREDFSCALLDAEGRLISSAPHIPVHLGALGVCVRRVREALSMAPGDSVVTNHPAFGGSHLPDVTVITPVFAPGAPSDAPASATPVAYIANRAHHAEIGGIAPGSMPPRAVSLAEEGVVIPPEKLVEGDVSRFEAVAERLSTGPWPTRRLRDNLADLNAQLAANRRGQALLEAMMRESSPATVSAQMGHLRDLSRETLVRQLPRLGSGIRRAEGPLDDGSLIRVALSCEGGRLKIDFDGSSPEHPGNLNATVAVVQSAVLYVLRLWTQSRTPLNEGMMEAVGLLLPQGMLNPAFDEDPARSPAVVGGNVETSQRLVDTLLHALELQACSQGTMNNFVFGNADFGYYETIGGGAGAGEGYDGASGLHTHMTNTAITDPEILEQRYPVRLRRFGLRRGSGGRGRWHGGDGLEREIEFLAEVEVSLLTQHRRVAPYGLAGGEAGACGRQSLNGEPLESQTAFTARPGDRLLIETPGGGGCGTPDSKGRKGCAENEPQS